MSGLARRSTVEVGVRAGFHVAVSRVGGLVRVAVPAVLGGAVSVALASSCAASRPCNGVACAPACPRDAVRDAAGRCACSEGNDLVLGACVSAAVGDAFCGPAARIGADGCVFRVCPASDELDVATGECAPRGGLAHPGAPCAPGASSIVESGHSSCVPEGATCPRGAIGAASSAGSPASDDAGGVAKARCVRPLRCPPGALPEGDACRSIFTVGGRSGGRVDIGAWVALVLGVDGGPGTPVLCDPLASRPAAFGLSSDTTASLRVHLAVRVPDQDVSRVHAEVRAGLRPSSGADGGAPPRSAPLTPVAESLVRRSIDTALEPLRSLGGEASTAAVDVDLRCALGPGSELGTRSGTE